MKIPERGREKFARNLIDICMASQVERVNRGAGFLNFALYGAETQAQMATYNKTFAYLDELQSLIYSPLELQVSVSSDSIMNALDTAKSGAASMKLKSFIRSSQLDSTLSDGVWASLVKGNAIIKLLHRRGFSANLIQPEAFGVLQENYPFLDEDMEAFVHQTYITPFQFHRLIKDHPDEAKLRKKAKSYIRDNEKGLVGQGAAMQQVIVGGMHPFQPAGAQSPTSTRGIVDWMSGPGPQISKTMMAQMMELNELWVWDDDRGDWATMQIVGNDMMVYGKYQTANALAYDPSTGHSDPVLKGRHPFTVICCEPQTDYFYGRSEIINVALLQVALNSRINGINMLLRKEEDPNWTFTGTNLSKQAQVSKLKKPGGYWADSAPNAKAQMVTTQIPPDLWLSVHEYERMFDEMSGVPPIARGKGDQGVRSDKHAETLVRMFSPRFKDRAIVTERDVTSALSLLLDMCRAFVPETLEGWVATAEGGLEIDPPTSKEIGKLMPAPAKGLERVHFTFADLPPNWRASVEGHTSSPAFTQERRQLMASLLQAGAAGPEDILRYMDVPDPEILMGELMRRAAQKAEERKLLLEIKAAQALHKGGGK